jgi:hypothetical protein
MTREEYFKVYYQANRDKKLAAAKARQLRVSGASTLDGRQAIS